MVHNERIFFIFAKKIMKEILNSSETRQCKVVFPSTLNDHDTLFGGIALQWMDEVAFIAATRYTRKNMITASVDKVSFLLPIKSGSIVEIIGKAVFKSHVKLKIQVELFVEGIRVENKQKAAEALFTFAAVNQEQQVIALGNDIS